MPAGSTAPERNDETVPKTPAIAGKMPLMTLPARPGSFVRVADHFLELDVEVSRRELQAPRTADPGHHRPVSFHLAADAAHHALSSRFLEHENDDRMATSWPGTSCSFPCDASQWWRSGKTTSPMTAAAVTITGSWSFLKRHSSSTVVTASSAVGTSTIDRFAMTRTEPVIAPTAAAVMRVAAAGGFARGLATGHVAGLRVRPGARRRARVCGAIAGGRCGGRFRRAAGDDPCVHPSGRRDVGSPPGVRRGRRADAQGFPAVSVWPKGAVRTAWRVVGFGGRAISGMAERFPWFRRIACLIGYTAPVLTADSRLARFFA